MAKNQVTLTFAGDDKSLSKTFGSLNKSAGQTQSRFASLHSGAKVLAAGLLGGLAVAVKAGFDEFQDGAKKSAQTAAVLKSTGNAAHVTQQQVEALATSISNKSGVDDQAIQSGQNMLLTFTNIRNEVGQGNNIFDQATQTMTDMSVAMGTDASKTAIQLGKALNDPIKGVTALSKVGVSFTQAQKAQIKAMVDAGNTAGAQKVVLQELQKEFGGSAAAAGKTLPGQLNILQNTFRNLAAQVIGAIVPALQKMVGWITDATTWFSKHEAITKVLVVALGGLAVSVLAVNKAVSAFQSIASAAQAISKLFVTQTVAATTATEGETLAQDGLNASMRANPIGIVITAIAGLATGFMLAWQHSETFRNIVTGVFDTVKSAAQTIVNFFKNDVVGAFEAVLTFLRGNWQAIATIISGPFAPIVALATNAFGVRSALVNAFEAVKDAVKTAMGWIGDRIGTVVDGIKTVVGGIGSAFSAAFNAAKRAIDIVMTPLRTAYNIINDIVSFFGGGDSHAYEKLQAFTNQNHPQGTVTITPGHTTVLNSSVGNNAAGGIINSRMLSWLGESGPEAVVPLTNPRRAMEVMGAAGLLPSGRGGNTYYLNVQAGISDPAAVSTAVIRAIDTYEQRNGQRYARAY